MLAKRLKKSSMGMKLKNIKKHCFCLFYVGVKIEFINNE